MDAQTQITSYETQIKALEFALQKAIDGNKPTANIFAINGKITKLKKQIVRLKSFVFLAK